MDAALRALAEPRRREILRLVWDRERAAGDIADHFDVTRPAVSQHLQVLKAAALVTERREGTRRLYLARRDTVSDLRRFLDDYWDSSLDRLRDVAEAAEREARERSASRPARERDAHVANVANEANEANEANGMSRSNPRQERENHG